jgi:chemotaxis protein CheY-P-specific phosphatase CheC
MKAQDRFDKLLLACHDRIQDEVAALIGKPFALGEAKFRQVDKETLFADLGGKQVLAHVRLEGDIQGTGCLLVGIKDAIHIGGTLIMLPEAELESVLAEQHYSEELQDSYGEVANIICGAATVTFEEQSNHNVRLIRTEQEVIVPIKVDIASEQPIADVPYYVMTAPMRLDGKDLGQLHFVVPAEPFGLVGASSPAKPAAPKVTEARIDRETDTGVQQDVVDVLKRETASQEAGLETGVLSRPAGEPATVSPEDGPSGRRPQRDVAKHKQRIDGLLANSLAKMCDEVSALLGGSLKITPMDNLAVTKEGFLDQAGGKQVMTRMELRGGGGGEAYLFVELKTAVYLGGCLIMLPESEIEETVRSEEFGDDARDAYGEITNIIAGVFTSVFEEQSRLKLGFVKTSIEPIIPAKIDPESDAVFANQAYYLSLGQMRYNERELGRLQLLIPAADLDLEDLLLAEEAPAAEDEVQAGSSGPVRSEQGRQATEPARLQGYAPEETDILIFTDDDREAGRIVNVLEEDGYVCRLLHFKDPVNAVLTSRVQMVLLVMQEVSEQGFGVAIKISSAGRAVPLIAAGPAWTRTLVLKAVKYGACDILITPSSSADVREKLANNLVKQAA